MDAIKNDISKTNLNYYKINTDFIPRIDISSIKLNASNIKASNL